MDKYICFIFTIFMINLFMSYSFVHVLLSALMFFNGSSPFIRCAISNFKSSGKLIENMLFLIAVLFFWSYGRYFLSTDIILSLKVIIWFFTELSIENLGGSKEVENLSATKSCKNEFNFPNYAFEHIKENQIKDHKDIIESIKGNILHYYFKMTYILVYFTLIDMSFNNGTSTFSMFVFIAFDIANLNRFYFYWTHYRKETQCSFSDYIKHEYHEFCESLLSKCCKSTLCECKLCKPIEPMCSVCSQ